MVIISYIISFSNIDHIKESIVHVLWYCFRIAKICQVGYPLYVWVNILIGIEW